MSQATGDWLPTSEFPARTKDFLMIDAGISY